MTPPWHRRRRHDADRALDPLAEVAGPGAADDVSLGGPEHAWWVGRDVERAWAPSSRAPRPDPLEVHLGPGWEHGYGFDDLTAPESEEDTCERGDVPAAERLTVGPYEVLGVDATASWEQIVAAHRDAVRRHHPDRVTGEGHEPEELARAENAIIRINAAYGELRVRRGR